MLECILQLQPSAADELGRLTQQPDRNIRAHKSSAFLDLPVAGQHVPSQNQCLGFLARIYQPPLDKQRVEPDFVGPSMGHNKSVPRSLGDVKSRVSLQGASVGQCGRRWVTPASPCDYGRCSQQCFNSGRAGNSWAKVLLFSVMPSAPRPHLAWFWPAIYPQRARGTNRTNVVHLRSAEAFILCDLQSSNLKFCGWRGDSFVVSSGFVVATSLPTTPN